MSDMPRVNMIPAALEQERADGKCSLLYVYSFAACLSTNAHGGWA